MCEVKNDKGDSSEREAERMICKEDDDSRMELVFKSKVIN